ncbi:hypothetical protein E4T52_03981 [Aureobasidium sp. EXF-3400]|nr:hypothetical protein E4T51_04450 [Aureobasidium sp. EXF-12344]KAI4781123.1 hypothetical protein E4T52_03981 [Aureobasidium sp. EXF-3400]
MSSLENVRVPPVASTAWRLVVTATGAYICIDIGPMLDRLSNEIIHSVLQNLATSPELIHNGDDLNYNHHRDNWATLAQLCKVSRQLRRLAEPFLYRNYAKPDSSLDPNKHFVFRKFLITVLERPELLQHVRSLYIGAWRYSPGSYRQYNADNAPRQDGHFPDELHDIYSKYVESSALSAGWRESLKAGEEVAEIALLMSLTANLEHIEFCMPDLHSRDLYAPQYFWPSLLVASGEWDPARHFQRLGSVMVHRRNLKLGYRAARRHYGFEIDAFLPFIGLPNLKVFRVENDTVGVHQKRPEDYPLNVEESHLTDLTLGISYIDPMKMIQILERCTKLEVFHCELQRPSPVPSPTFSWDIFREALDSSRGTLKELTLDADELSERPNTDGTSVSIGPLTDFTSLRKLVIPQSALLGSESIEDYSTLGPSPPLEEILPSSLESLTIERCSFNIVPYLEDISSKLEDKFPHLREIRLIAMDMKVWQINDGPDGEFQTVVKGREDRVVRLKEAFTAAGVRCLQAFDRDDDEFW